jgi:hypothetical protein
MACAGALPLCLKDVETAAEAIRFGRRCDPNCKPSEGKDLSIQETKQPRSKPDDGSLLRHSGKNVVFWRHNIPANHYAVYLQVALPLGFKIHHKTTYCCFYFVRYPLFVVSSQSARGVAIFVSKCSLRRRRIMKGKRIVFPRVLTFQRVSIEWLRTFRYESE